MKLLKKYGTKATVKEETITTVDTTPLTEEVKEPEPPKVTITASVPKTEVVEQPKPQIPTRPIMPPEAAAFPKLQKIKATLDKHNHLIFEAETERNNLDIELSDLKGLARLTEKKLTSRTPTDLTKTEIKGQLYPSMRIGSWTDIVLKSYNLLFYIF